MSSSNEEVFPVPQSLAAVLKAMPEKQIMLFGDYMRFEHFNNNQRLSDLHAIILAHHLKTRKKHTDWKGAIEKVGIPESQINKLFTLYHQKLDQFLSFQQIQTKPHRYHGYTLEAYHHLNVEFDVAEKKWRQLLKKLQNDSQSSEHFQQLLQLEHFFLQTRIRNAAKTQNSYFEEIHQQMDEAYLISKIIYLCASLNEAYILNQPVPNEILEQVRPLIERNQAKLPPIGQAYLMVLEILEYRNLPQTKYAACTDYIIENQKSISGQDITDLLSFVLNSSFRRIAKAENEFEQQIIDIYQYLIDLNLLLEDGLIAGRTFKNIVSINCRMGKYEWCDQFIKDFRKYLPKDEQETLPLYCQGLVYFYAENYTESAKIFKEIIRIDPDDLFWGFESRNLLLRSYYHIFDDLDMETLEEFYKLVESFKMYVRRNAKLSEFHKTSYLNSITYFSSILKHREQYGTDVPFPQKLISELEATNLITNKNWLLSIVKEK